MEKRTSLITPRPSPVVLLILDGFGLAKASAGNAISQAWTPNLKAIMKKYPSAKLLSYGKYVGLPSNQVGNSEAGHLQIGSGRLVEQDAIRIGRAIKEGSFFRNPIFINAFEHVKKNRSCLHLIGLLSNGQSAHSDPHHLLALITLTRMCKVSRVYLHLFLDGRDSRTHESLKLVEALERDLRHEKIATIMGRYYAMDRKKNWKKTEQAYNAMVHGEGVRAKSPQAAITESYNRGETDEFIAPYIMMKGNSMLPRIEDSDAVIFFNLRSDRARQISKAFVQKHFETMNPKSFKRKKVLKNLYFVAMTHFGPDLGNIETAYPQEPLADTLPILLGKFRQIYITEAEKYAHMTYFFNGGYPDQVAHEIRIKISSPDRKHYEKTPGMSIGKITRRAVKSLGHFDFIAINFSSPDMIGHTGNLKSAIKAVEYVDTCIGRLEKEILKRNGIFIITADHGNIECMIDTRTQEISTEHTKNPVPFIFVSRKKIQLKKGMGTLQDIAPTILELFGIPIPIMYTGKSLISKIS